MWEGGGGEEGSRGGKREGEVETRTFGHLGREEGEEGGGRRERDTHRDRERDKKYNNEVMKLVTVTDYGSTLICCQQ